MNRDDMTSLGVVTMVSLVFLLLHAERADRQQHFNTVSYAERVLEKRDIYDNIRKNDPKSKCRNGGIYAGGQCHCIHPHTGKTCEDFACVSRVYATRAGKEIYANIISLTEGEWKNNRCECIGSFFGDECQFTSRCDNGVIKHGRCICNKHFEGDYCERIICYHGYANLKNMSQSCICPAKYKGLHCDQCSQVGPKIQPYPICTVNYIPSHARQSRKKTNQQRGADNNIEEGTPAFTHKSFPNEAIHKCR
ncbi:unnamed protein product [Nippostrongylus brasiliensis]|uniref:EGF-like domain-containing protein n=1 Tax=Nippostrongylus brasiliensis TaxID=27835 RepID=A0A0N4XZD4_NIPBR|nr:unnamed protein product [Nippostrongylus brasiliensis]